MNAAQIKQKITELAIAPTKHLGQNFLTCPSTAQGIVDLLEISNQDTVVEIGPGLESLTQPLLNSVAKKIILIEFDRKIAYFLQQKYQDNSRIVVHHADAAQFDIGQLYSEGRDKVKLLGNLPYNAGGAILKQFMSFVTPITRAVIMLQKEVIANILAKPKTKSYGMLSVRMQHVWDMQQWQVLKPHLFYPSPTIDSAVIVCSKKDWEQQGSYDYIAFERMVKLGFAQRRKQVRKQLQYAQWEAYCQQHNISPLARAEELTVADWIALVQHRYPPIMSGQNKDEVLEVVNAQDQVIVQQTRQQIHAENLYHRAVHIFVTDGKGNYYLQQRSKSKDVDAGLWSCSAAGHVDPGESYLQTAERELAEELGITRVSNWRKLIKIPASKSSHFEFIEVYLVESKQKPYPAMHEVRAVVKLSKEMIAAWVTQEPVDFSLSFLHTWQQVAAQL